MDETTRAVPGAAVLLGRNNVLAFAKQGSSAAIRAISAYELRISDFTIEAWFNSRQGGPLISLCSANADLLQLHIATGGKIQVLSRGAKAFEVGQGSTALDANWHHVALTRLDGVFTLYLDGVQQASGTGASAIDLSGLTELRFGKIVGTPDARSYVGYLTEVRFWSVARSQESLRSSMFYRLAPNDTVLGYWAFEDRSLRDQSQHANNSGKLHGGACFELATVSYSSASGQLRLTASKPSVEIRGHEAYNVGAGDFTLETWVLARSDGDLISRISPRDVGAAFRLSLAGRGRLQFSVSDGSRSATVVQPASTPTIVGGWHHVAASRSGRILRLFIDGVSVAEATESAPTSITLPHSVPLVFGHHQRLLQVKDVDLQTATLEGEAVPPPEASQPFQMLLADVRFWRLARTQEQIYRNMAVQPHDSENGLFGYWNFTTGNVVDRSRVGNAVVSAAEELIAPGGVSLDNPQHLLKLDGSSESYMAVPSSEVLNPGDRDFTVEVRFRATQRGTLLGRAGSAPDASGIQLRIEDKRIECILNDGTPTVYAADAAVLDGQWHHLAWVRAEGKLTCFLDMRMRPCSPATSTHKIASGDALFVGAHRTSTSHPLSDFIVGEIDFVYLFKRARSLSDLQRSSYVSIDSPAAGWNFDQGAPIDQGFSRANGTLSNNARIIPDYTLPVAAPLSELHLRGAESYLDCGSRTDLKFSERASYTLGAWISPDSEAGTGTIAGRFGQAAGYGLCLVDGVPVAKHDGVAVKGVTPLRPGRWYFVAATFDGSKLAVSVNGAEEGAIARGVAAEVPSASFVIGASGAGEAARDFLRGDVQSVQVWDRCLTRDEIADGMRSSLTGTERGLKALWNFIYAFSDDWTGNGAAPIHRNAFYRRSALEVSATSAIALDGTSAYVDCGDDHSLNLRGPMTIEAWVRINRFDAEWQTIAAKGQAYQLRRFQNQNVITFSTAGLTPSELPSVNANFLDGGWHHIAGTFDGRKKVLYVDGKPNASVEVSGVIDPDDRMVYVGAASASGSRLVGLDPEKGEIVKSIALAPHSKAGGVPVPAGRDIIVIRGTDMIAAVNTRIGQVLWQRELPGPGVDLAPPPAVVYRGKAYVTVPPSGGIVAFDVRTGKSTTIVPGEVRYGAPVIRDHVLYHSDSAGGKTLYAIDLRRRELLWRQSMEGMITNRGINFLDDTVLVLSYFSGEHPARGRIAPLRLGGTKPVVGEPYTAPGPFQELVVEDGVVYARCGSFGGDRVYALSYDAQRNALDRKWDLSPGSPTSFVYPSLAAEDPYVAMGTARALLTFTPNGTRHAAAVRERLCNLQIANGMLYSWDGDVLYAFDLPASQGGNLPAVWRAQFKGTRSTNVAVKSAPFSIGARIGSDGAPQALLNGLVCEVRLWSKARLKEEIEATWQRRLTGDEEALRAYWPCSSAVKQSIADLAPHHNPGTLVNSAWVASVDLQLKEPLPYVTAQARMMRQWSRQDQTAERGNGHIAFRTEIHVFDGARRPLQHGAVRVWTDEAATIIVNGVEYQTGEQQAALLTTDGRGVLTVVTPCKALTSPTLQIWIDSMGPKDRVIIHPDDNLNHTLGKISGSDLRDPASSNNPLLKSKEPLRNFKPEEAEGLASAINSAVSNVKRPIDQSSLLTAPLEVLDGPRTRNPRDNALSHLVQLKEGKQYKQLPGPGNIPNWQFHFKEMKFKPLSESDALEAFVAPAGVMVVQQGDPGFAGLWQDFVDGVHKAVDIVISGVKYAVQIVVNEVTHLIEGVFETIKQVGEAIFGLFRQLVAAAEKIYEFFAFLFDWKDILAVKNKFVELSKGAFERGQTEIDSVRKKLDEFLKNIEQQFKDVTDRAIERLGQHSLDASLDGYNAHPTWNPLAPQVGGVPSMVPILGAVANGPESPSTGAEGNWFFSTMLENSGGISGGGEFGYADSFDALGNSLQSILDDFLGAQARDSIQKAYSYFAAIGTHPEAIGQLLMQGLLEAMSAIVELGIELARKVLGLVLDAVKSALSQMLDFLAAPIEIPIISWLYKINAKADLSLLDLGALIVAVPTTVLYKAFTGKSPRMDMESSADTAVSTGGYTVLQLVCRTGYAIAGLMWGALDVVGGAIGGFAWSGFEYISRLGKTVVGAIIAAVSAPWIYDAAPLAGAIVAWSAQLVNSLCLIEWCMTLIVGGYKRLSKGLSLTAAFKPSATGGLVTNIFNLLLVVLDIVACVLFATEAPSGQQIADFLCSVSNVFGDLFAIGRSVAQFFYEKTAEPNTKAIFGCVMVFFLCLSAVVTLGASTTILVSTWVPGLAPQEA